MPRSSASYSATARLREDTDPAGELEEMLDVFSKMPAAIGDALFAITAPPTRRSAAVRCSSWT